MDSSDSHDAEDDRQDGGLMFQDSFDEPSFEGQFSHVIDSKGRITLPSEYREMLAKLSNGSASNGAAAVTKVVMTKTFDQYLEFYPIEQWNRFVQGLRRLPRQDKMVTKIKRVYITNAKTLQVDNSGRLLIPIEYRKSIGLEKEVVWVGSLETFELWSATNWEAAQEEALSDPDAIAEAMSDFKLSLSRF